MATSRIVNMAAAAAMTGLIGGAALTTVGCQHDSAGTTTGATTMAAHDCKGMNACKGLGGCKTADHACKGQNSCKGQGGCKGM
jgi:hypothetical protein